MKTAEDKYAFIKLRAEGFSFDKIAEAIDVSKPTLIKWMKDEEMHLAIANQKSLDLQDLQEQWLMTRRHRIESLSIIYHRAKDELEKRDISELSTDKLVNLVIQTSKALKSEEQDYTITVANEEEPSTDKEQFLSHSL